MDARPVPAGALTRNRNPPARNAPRDVNARPVPAGASRPSPRANRAHRDALAARRYRQAYQAVRGSVRRAVAVDPPGTMADHCTWYREGGAFPVLPA